MKNLINIIDTIVFDFDGVIADTDSGRFLLLSEILAHYQIDMNSKYSFNDIIGLSTKTFLKSNFKELNDDQISEIISLRHDKYLANLNKYCIPIPFVIDLIKILYSKHKRLAIATTNDKNITIKMLDHFNITNYLLKFLVES